MKKVTLSDFVTKRIEENKNLFSEQEYKLIKKNLETIKKIYILGAKDGIETFLEK